MNKAIAIASGKGGVGKTTLSLNLAAAASSFGYQPIVVDGNFSTPNIALHLGAPQLPVTIHNVLKGTHQIEQAIYSHPSGFRVIPSSVAYADHEQGISSKLKPHLESITDKCHLTFFDTCPGIDRETEDVLSVVDSVVAVTTPDLPAVMDTLKTIKLAKSLNKKVIGVIINMSSDDPVELTPMNVATLLETHVLGVVQFDRLFKEALAMRHPLFFSHPESDSSRVFRHITAKILGVKLKPKKEIKKWWWFK